MKAWMLNNIDEFNFYEDVPIPDINSDEVLLKVKAAGICGSDVPRVYKNGAHNMPLIIGHEFAGIVEKAGSSDNKYLVGKHVGVFPLIPCKKCLACLSKRYEMCSNYSYLGSRINGGFAEYVSVPAWNLIEIPDSITFEQAAMLEPMAVSVHAIRQLNLHKDDNVLVCGAGTIGQLIVMFLLEAGIKNVYLLGTKPFHREISKKIGLPEQNFYLVKDTNQKDLVDFYMSATNSKGIDAYFECVGKNDTISQGIDIVNPGGKICFVGNPSDDIILRKDTYWKILRKQLTIKGTWNSLYLGDDKLAYKDDWHYVLNLLKEGKIHPELLITHKLNFKDLAQGLSIMRYKTQDYIKIMTAS